MEERVRHPGLKPDAIALTDLITGGKIYFGKGHHYNWKKRKLDRVVIVPGGNKNPVSRYDGKLHLGLFQQPNGTFTDFAQSDLVGWNDPHWGKMYSDDIAYTASGCYEVSGVPNLTVVKILDERQKAFDAYREVKRKAREKKRTKLGVYRTRGVLRKRQLDCVDPGKSEQQDSK